MAQVSYLSMFSSEDLGDKGRRLEKLDRRVLASGLPRVSASRKATPPQTSPAHKDPRKPKTNEPSRPTGEGQAMLLLEGSKDALKARQRTTTWPEEYYRVWLDISNLPVASSIGSREQTPRVRTADWLGSLTRTDETRERVAREYSMETGRNSRNPLLQLPKPISKSSDAHLPPLAHRHDPSNDPHGNVLHRAPHTVSRMRQNSLQASITHHLLHMYRDQQSGALGWRQGTQPIPILQLKTLGRNPLNQMHRHSRKRIVDTFSGSVAAGRHSDVSPPPSPPHLSPAYRVVGYVSTTTSHK